MSEETREIINMADLVEPPMKPYLNPIPPKGKVFDYRFVKEVSTVSEYFNIGCIRVSQKDTVLLSVSVIHDWQIFPSPCCLQVCLPLFLAG